MARSKGRPFTSEQDRQKAAEAGRKGGRASGVAKRKKRVIRDVYEILRGMPLYDGDLDEIEEISSIASVNGKNITVEEAMVFAMMGKAANGDTRAYEVLMKYNNEGKMLALNMERAKAEIQRVNLENERLKLQLDAYKDAMSEHQGNGVQIIDDIPNEA